jgi:putative membrane protein
MMWGNDEYGFHQGGHPWVMVGMGIFWIALAILTVWLIVRLVERRPHHPAPPAVHEGRAQSLETPREILDRRFASGEITAEQYSEAKKLLKLDK